MARQGKLISPLYEAHLPTHWAREVSADVPGRSGFEGRRRVLPKTDTWANVLRAGEGKRRETAALQDASRGCEDPKVVECAAAAALW